MKYKCIICEYVYDEEEGCSESSLPPGTKYEEIPDEWTCPDCGVDKTYLDKI